MENERKRDAEIMGRVGAGDAAVWRELADRELPRVLALATRILDDRREAEEVAQEAFTRLWRQASHWRDEARIGTWLYRVTRNLCIDRLRGRRREVALEEVAELPAPGRDPLRPLERAESLRLVEEALARLPERQRTALFLVYRLEMGLPEAAAVMEVGLEALSSLLARGRRGMRRMLAFCKDDLLEDGDEQ